MTESDDSLLDPLIRFRVDVNPEDSVLVPIPPETAALASSDPKTDKNAILYDKITHLDVIKQQLKVMDTTAVTLCMENNIDIVVFNMSDTNNLIRVINGENIGTIIRKEF